MNIEKIIKGLEEEHGFFHHNNYHVESIEKNEIVLKVDLTEDSTNPYGVAHGGIIFGLGDTAMGLIAVQKGLKAVTLDSNISYLKPGVGKYLYAKAEKVREGETIYFAKSNIYNEKKELVATLTGTYYYIEKRGKDENDR